MIDINTIENDLFEKSSTKDVVIEKQTDLLEQKDKIIDLIIENSKNIINTLGVGFRRYIP